jgi:hypothetical protein
LPENRLLVYAQDQGGGRFMGPVIKALIQTREFPGLIILIHPLSGAFFHKLGIPHFALADAVGAPPLPVGTWEEFLKEKSINRVFCTTSSPYLDLTNCHLIVAAKKLGIPVMGIMDHWKGFDRFFSKGTIAFLPDHTCCIDEFCKRRFLDLGVPAYRIHTIGHPYLERICQQSWEGHISGDKIRILLISQPNTTDQSFKGIFFHPIGKYRLIDEIICLVARVFPGKGQGIQLKIRPHPKERLMEAMPIGVEIDENQEWNQSIRENDIFVGLDSMALIEAHLAGKYSISLLFPELQGLSDNSIPFAFSKNVKGLSELTSALEDAIKIMTKGKRFETRFPAILEDSTKRTLAVLDEFIKGALK